MITKVIGIKEYRKNITSLWKEAQQGNIRYIVMYHAKPIFEVKPLDEEEFILENFREEIAEAREQASKGESVSHEVLMAEYGINKTI